MQPTFFSSAKIQLIFFLIIVISFFQLQSCVVIEPNQLGLRQRLGQIDKTVLKPGSHGTNPFTQKIIKYDCKILNYNEKSQYSTNDGLEVTAEMNLLYHINKDSLIVIHTRLGKNFEEKYVGSLFRSVVREEVIQYNAKDIMNKIENLEDSISDKLIPLLKQYGFVLDKMIVSDIDLPIEVSDAIKQKVKAEQVGKQKEVENEIDRQSTDYAIEKERKQQTANLLTAKQESEILLEKQKAESARMILEARSKKIYQQIIDSSLTDKQLQLRKIEANEKLSTSPNTKLIITDGKNQLYLKMDEK
jgi:regulator of protease activity HflC (stomatin/prohibitin superfamily)